MKDVIGLDGREYRWNYSFNSHRSQRANKSKPHIAAVKLIKSLYPFYGIFEEVSLPGSKSLMGRGMLYCDIFIPGMSLVVEVHGEQHYKYIPFFHETKGDFARAQKRDRDKIEWCELNDLSIAILPHDKEDQWETIINTAMTI